MTSKTSTLKIGKRALELQKSGYNGIEQTEIINQEFTDRVRKAGTIRAAISKYKKSQEDAPTSEAEKNQPEPDNGGEPEINDNEPHEIEDRMRIIAKEVYEEMFGEAGEQIDKADRPPEPTLLSRDGKGKGKENRSYQKFSATLDTALWKLLKADMKRERLSLGRMLDLILWRYYGRPTLSYESDKN